MMALDYPNGTWTVATLPVIAVLLVIGWFSLRKRAQEVAAEHRNMPVKESGTKAVPPLICMNKSQ